MQTVLPRSYHSLSLRLTGEVVIKNGDKSFVSTHGCVTFMPAGVSYLTEVRSTSCMLLIYFKTLEDYNNLRPFSIDVNDNKTLQNLFYEIETKFGSGKEKDYECMSILYSILAIIEKEYLAVKQKHIPKRMKNAKKFIDDNFDSKISVTELSESAGISEVHFRNEFKQCYGLSPLSYIKHVRIDNAKLMLCSGYYDISDVAIRCGFDSISYFSYEFKRITGMTPTEYKKSII